MAVQSAGAHVQRSRQTVAFSGGAEDRVGGHGNLAGQEDAPNGSAVAEAHQQGEEEEEVQPCRHEWAALMPRLSDLLLPCSTSVCMDHKLLLGHSGHASTPLVVPPHLQPPLAHGTRERSDGELSRVRQDAAVRALYGVHTPEARPQQQQAAAAALHCMPSRRETRDFYVQKEFKAAIGTRRASVPGWGGMPISSAAACWQRLARLPQYSEACAWEALLSRPAAAAERAFHGTSDRERVAGVRQLTRSLLRLDADRMLAAAGAQHDARGSGCDEPLGAEQESTAGDPSSVRRTWRELEGVTDATGVCAVRTAWIAALGRLQPVTQRAHAPADSLQGGGAFQDLQAAIQGLQAWQQRPAQQRWGDHAAVRERAFAAGARANAMSGSAEPHLGSMGAVSTPDWLPAAGRCAAAPGTAVPSASGYWLTTAMAATQAARRDGTSTGSRDAAIAHAWARMLPGARAFGDPSSAQIAAVGREGLPHGDVWVMLLGEHGPLWVKAASRARAPEAATAPPPLTACRMAPHAHNAWDVLLQGCREVVDAHVGVHLVGQLPRLLGAARAPAAAQFVWSTMSSAARLAEERTRQCWHALAGRPPVVTAVPRPTYAHADRAVGDPVLQWRALGIEGVWGALWRDSSGTASHSGALRRLGGSTFDRRRQTSRDSMDGEGSEAGVASVDVQGTKAAGWTGVQVPAAWDEAAAWAHINRGAEAAAGALHARAARFEDQWANWDERWVSHPGSARGSTPSAVRSVQPKVYVSALSYVPVDLPAARRMCVPWLLPMPCKYFLVYRLGSEAGFACQRGGGAGLVGIERLQPWLPCRLSACRQRLSQAVADKQDVSRQFVAGVQERRRLVFTAESSGSEGRSAWRDLVTLAELLMMHSSMHAQVSPSAWFPSDDFVVQFQQHRCDARQLSLHTCIAS